jgi:hypothetical protein
MASVSSGAASRAFKMGMLTVLLADCAYSSGPVAGSGPFEPEDYSTRPPVQAAVQIPELLIFGGEDHREFLGCLNCSEFSSSSVWNEMSEFGWQNGFGKWNSFGPYKNSFSSNSACNEFASDPPVIVDRSGNFYGRLTMGELQADSVCGVNGAENVCQALKVMCAG